MNGQNKEIDSLFKEMIRSIPVEAIYGNYEKPVTLKKLEGLAEADEVDLITIGFFLIHDKPFMPAPTDLIPFATTGGDGCYFAFLTDYGYNENLEEAPIVFISPSDFDEKHPHHANKLFAKNIRDFLSVMITMKYAEIVRFENLVEMDFDKGIAIMQAEFDLYSSNEKKELRRSTIETIKKAFNIKEIENLHEYYLKLDIERKKEDYVDLRDGLGIKTRLTNTIRNQNFSDQSTLDYDLSQATKMERLKFYREAPYLHMYFKDDYQNVVSLIAKYQLLDGFIRESNILRFETEQYIRSKKYHEARQVFLKQEKDK